MVADVCALNHGRHQAEDIHGFLLKGICQLWLSWRDGIEAIAVTEIVCYPRLKAVRIFQLRGKDREHWLGFERLIATWAKSEGCTRMELIGRKGWSRVLPHWENHVFLERAI